MDFYAYQIAIFVVLHSFISETTSLCCHLPYMQSLPCGIESKSVSELKSLEPNDEGREVGMPSSIDILTDMFRGLCSYSLCSPGYIKKNGKVFCSTGSCNMFGCNCDGECINNNYVDEYLQRLRKESNDTNLTYEYLSRARRSPRSRSRSNNDVDVDVHTSTKHSEDKHPPGTSIGYDHDKHKHLFDYNGNFIMPRNMLTDAKKAGSITGNIVRDLTIDFMSTLAAEYVSKKWLFPEDNKVNMSALTTILNEYNATIKEIVMKFDKPFKELNSTQQDAFVHKAQIINLIDSNNGNATQAIQTFRNLINDA